MRDVEINYSLAVFKTFCVEANKNDQEREREPYIPSFLLPAALREMGYYPVLSKVESFLERISCAANDGIRCSVFLQLCKELAMTRDLCMAAVHQFVYELESINPSGVFTTEELLKLLDPSACSMTQEETEAIIDMLDPMQTNCISLTTLATVLLRGQRPLDELPCRPLVSDGTYSKKPKTNYPEISSLAKRKLICRNYRNDIERSLSSKTEALSTAVALARQRGQLATKDRQDPAGKHSLHSHSDPYIASPIHLKSSPNLKRHFTHSPTDMSVSVDSRTGSERLNSHAIPPRALEDKNMDKPIPFNNSAAITFDKLGEDGAQNLLTDRAHDRSDGSFGPENCPRKDTVYKLPTEKQRDNRNSCCAVC